MFIAPFEDSGSVARQSPRCLVLLLKPSEELQVRAHMIIAPLKPSKPPKWGDNTESKCAPREPSKPPNMGVNTESKCEIIIIIKGMLDSAFSGKLAHLAN